jgi:hypothetical protein
MTTNRLKASAPNGKERSPHDPHECCDWANGRMHPDARNLGFEWVVTGDKQQPIALRLSAGA